MSIVFEEFLAKFAYVYEDKSYCTFCHADLSEVDVDTVYGHINLCKFFEENQIYECEVGAIPR